MTVLPTTTSEITAEWMTEALRGSGTIGAGASVESVALDPASAGVGFMGEVASVGVAYAGDAGNAPTTIVAKFPTQSPEIREMMHPTRIYEREHSFYNDIAAQTPLRTPDIFHITCVTGETPGDESYMLLMEDLSSLTLGDQVTGASPEQARAALVGLAAHHARFWNGAGLEQASYIPIIDGPLNQAGSAIYEASLPGFMEAFGKDVKAELADFVASYAATRPQILADLAAMPHTLVHFDFRADNLFFDDAGDVVVIDWQAISQGGGAADVGYFLSQNLTTVDRRANEADLLQGVPRHAGRQRRRRLLVRAIAGRLPRRSCVRLDDSGAGGRLARLQRERAIALWTEVIERTQNALVDHGFGT